MEKPLFDKCFLTVYRYVNINVLLKNRDDGTKQTLFLQTKCISAKTIYEIMIYFILKIKKLVIDQMHRSSNEINYL